MLAQHPLPLKQAADACAVPTRGRWDGWSHRWVAQTRAVAERRLVPRRLSSSPSFTPPQATHPSHSACSDDSKHDIPSSSADPAPTPGGTARAPRARRAATGRGRGSATATPSTAGGAGSRLGRDSSSVGSARAPSKAAAAAAAAAATVGTATPSGSGAATPLSSSGMAAMLEHDPFEYDPFASDEELKAGAKRTRRRVTVATRDEETGRTFTQAEIRRMKRRITNRESARRMRLKRQEEWGIAKAQHRAMRDERARLLTTLADAQATATAAAEDAGKWQTLWRSAVASNLALSRRVAEIGGGDAGAAPPPSAGGSLDGAPPELVVGAAAHPNLLRGLSGLAASLLPSPRDGPSPRPSSAGTPRSGGGRRRTNPGALAGGAADLAAAGRAATAVLPLPDDVALAGSPTLAGLEFGGFAI